MYKDRVRQLLSEHWEYIQGVLEASDLNIKDIDCIAFHYKTSGEHFYKHALEDLRDGYYTLEEALSATD